MHARVRRPPGGELQRALGECAPESQVAFPVGAFDSGHAVAGMRRDMELEATIVAPKVQRGSRPVLDERSRFGGGQRP